ncbi:MAG: hypothetical protein RhofKO_33360 [Rhodothermales bacterium]
MVRVVVLIAVLCVGALKAQAQGFGVYRDTLDVTLEQPFLLRSFVAAPTFLLTADGAPVDTSSYRLDARYGRLWVTLPLDSVQALVATYRTLNVGLREVYRRRTLIVADSTTGAATIALDAATTETTPFDPFAGSTLQRSGSISRGVLTGNNRDVTIESGLNLSLAGEIAPGINVQAALTDANTPILPEGNTQRLSDFDRVFIEVQTARATAQLGDFDLAFRSSQFAQFSRKLQGVTVFNGLQLGTAPRFAGRGQVAGATTRGIFRWQPIVAQEGVQGPYRLEGANGEQFILVIPGSEAVYLDGERLTRGESNDYVIDYTTAEVTFTPRRLITAERRLLIEFQYTTNQFTRTLLAAESEAFVGLRADGSSRFGLGATVIREADSEQFNEELGFTSADSALVANAGDEDALASGASIVPFDPESDFTQYLREIRDFNEDGVVDTFFVAVQARPADDELVYRVRFTRVGAGRGSYIRQGRALNGIVYEYVGPGQGEYIDKRLLAKPRRQRLVDLNGHAEIIRGLEVFGEWSESLNDENSLSAVGAEDDIGHAYLGGVRLRPRMLVVQGREWGRLEGEVRRQMTGAQFSPFNRTRPVEFARRWNVQAQPVATGTTILGDEVVNEGEVRWALGTSTAQAAYGRIELGEAFTGNRAAFQASMQPRIGTQLRVNLEDISSQNRATLEDGRWFRSLARVAQPLRQGRWTPSVEWEVEDRRQRVLGTDSLARTSFAFAEYRPGLQWQNAPLGSEAEPTVRLGGSVEYRAEDGWQDGLLADAGQAWTVQSSFDVRPSAAFVTNGDVGYRRTRFGEAFRVPGKRENAESVVIQWKATARPLNRAIDLRWTYEALTEKTPTLQEIYIRTGPELGEYVWEDANADGVIQVDEFVPERTPNEGNYVQSFLPSDSLTSIISVQASLNLRLDPSRLIRSPKTRFQRFIAGTESRTSISVLEKSEQPDLKQIYLLNLSQFRDALFTQNGRLRVSEQLTLFRRNTKWGASMRYTLLRSLRKLATGQEARDQDLVSGEVERKFGQTVAVQLAVERETQSAASAFESRSYAIESVGVAPSVRVNFTSTANARLSADIARKTDSRGDRSARVLRVPLDLSYARARRLFTTVRAEVARVDLDGEASGLAQYELTEGRGPGTSFLWLLNVDYQLSRYLTAKLTYDGRAPATSRVIHTVRMQLSARF